MIYERSNVIHSPLRTYISNVSAVAEAGRRAVYSSGVADAFLTIPLYLSVNHAPVAQWIEQLTSEHPRRSAVALTMSGGAYPVELSALIIGVARRCPTLTWPFPHSGRSGSP